MLTAEQKALAAHLLECSGYLGRAESWAEGRIADDWQGEPNACPRLSKCALPPDVVPVDVAASLTASTWSDRRAKILPDLESMAKAKRAAIAGTLPERLSAAARCGHRPMAESRLVKSAPGPLDRL
jgi:hypothetical protein